MWGALSVGQKSLCVLREHDLFSNNVLGSEASTPGSRFESMVFG